MKKGDLFNLVNITCFFYLTLCILVDFLIHIDTIGMGQLIVQIKGHR